MANEVQRVRQAIVALIEADVTLQTLLDRSTDMVRAVDQLGNAPLPMLVLGVPSWDPQSRRMTVPLGAVADAGTNGPTAVTEALLVQLEAVLSALGFNAQGVDAVPFPFDRDPGDIDAEGSPTLTIAEATATLLVFA